MGLWSRTKKSVKAFTEPTKPASYREAIFPSGPGEDPDENLWEPLTTQHGLRRGTRNLKALDQKDMIDYAHHFYKGNPLAKRMIDIPAEYAIGDGIGFVAPDPQVRQILYSHWTDTTNRWSIDQFEKFRDLGLTGELCITTHVNSQNGHVTLGNIDPSLIDMVVNYKDNQMKPAAVILRKLRGETHRRAYKIIDISESSRGKAVGRLVGLPKNAKEQDEFGVPFKVDDVIQPSGAIVLHHNLQAKWVGSCFFFTVNNPLSANRGWSDLMSTFDWIDEHDQYLFSQVEKAIDSAKFVWDMLLKGMNEAQIRAYLADQPPFKAGERFGHNEGVEIKAQSPDLHLDDVSFMANTLKNHIIAGSGLPPIWFAESSISRASAPEMTEPAFKHIRLRQRYIAYSLSLIFRFVLDQAILSGRLKQADSRSNGTLKNLGVKNASFYLRMPDVSAKDQRALAVALNHLATALDKAVKGEYIAIEDAKRIFKEHLALSGLDTWKDEPHMQASSDLTPEQGLDDVFSRVTEGKTEFSNGVNTFYLSVDPQWDLSQSRELIESEELEELAIP